MRRKCTNTTRHEFPNPFASHESRPDRIWAFCPSCAEIELKEGRKLHKVLDEMKEEDLGHWTINGVPACKSPFTEGVKFYPCDGRDWCYTVCYAPFKDLKRMKEACLAKHPNVKIEIKEGRCP